MYYYYYRRWNMELYKSYFVTAVQSIWCFYMNNNNNYVSVDFSIRIYKLLQLFYFRNEYSRIHFITRPAVIAHGA